MSKPTHIKLERIGGGRVLVLWVGDGHVAFTDKDRPRILDLLQNDNVRPLRRERPDEARSVTRPARAARVSRGTKTR